MLDSEKELDILHSREEVEDSEIVKLTRHAILREGGVGRANSKKEDPAAEGVRPVSYAISFKRSIPST